MWLQFVLPVCLVFFVEGKTVSDSEYASMPPIYHMDDYDKCMLYGENALYCGIHFQLQPKNVKNVSGVWNIIQKVASSPQYFRHDVLRHGICVTEQCPNIPKAEILKNNSKYIKKLSECYSSTFEKIGLVGEIEIKMCMTNESPYSVNNYDLLFGYITMTFVLLVIYASIHEALSGLELADQIKRNTIFDKFISSFALSQNWRRLTNINFKNPDVESLSCLQGVRFFNTVTVIIIHTFAVNVVVPILNTQHIEARTDNRATHPLVLGIEFTILQPFFLMSAWLLTNTFCYESENKKTVPVSYLLQKFWTRILRLTPPMAIVVLFTATWSPHIGDGPFWGISVGDEYKICRKNWWTNLIYINNFLDLDTMCSPHLWSLSVDIQFYVVALIILWFLWNYPEKFLRVFGSIWVYHVVYTFYRIYGRTNYTDRSPERMLQKSENTNELIRIYKLASSNLPGVLGGVAYGYISYKYRDQQIFTKKIGVAAWWILSWGSMLVALALPAIILSSFGDKANDAYQIYVCLGRSIYIFGCGLFILGMTQGNGGIIRDVCKWPPIYVLGRLTYGAYLIHPIILRVRVGLIRTPSFLNSYLLVFECVTAIASSFVLALFLTLFFEMPIERLITRVLKSKTSLPAKSD